MEGSPGMELLELLLGSPVHEDDGTQEGLSGRVMNMGGRQLV